MGNYSDNTEGTVNAVNDDNKTADTGNAVIDDKGGEKTFTQAEVDRLMKDRVRREVSKYADYDDLKEAFENSKKSNDVLKEMSSVLAEGAGIPGTPTEQINALREYYGITKKQAEKVIESIEKQPIDDDMKKAVAYYKAEREVKKLSDEDLVEEYERILDIPERKRADIDKAKLEVLQDRYSRIQFGKEVKEAESWYVKEIGNDFEAQMKDADFVDFAKSSRLSLKDALKTYLKLVGKNEKRTSNPGSVKTTGTVKEKDYYTPEEADKLTSKDLDNPKIFEAVRRSMTKWKK